MPWITSVWHCAFIGVGIVSIKEAAAAADFEICWVSGNISRWRGTMYE
jgi:hypothetical protein